MTVNLKALVFCTGLALIGAVGTSAMANIPSCKNNHGGKKKSDSKYCRGSDYVFSLSNSCKCPNPSVKPDFTRKCGGPIAPSGQVVYTCEQP